MTFKFLSLLQIAALEKSLATSVAIALGAKDLCIAGFAIDVFVWAIAAQHGIQRLFALFASEAPFVINVSLGKHLFRVEHLSPASGATLSRPGLNRGGVRIARIWLIWTETRLTLLNKRQLLFVCFFTFLQCQHSLGQGQPVHIRSLSNRGSFCSSLKMNRICLLL